MIMMMRQLMNLDLHVHVSCYSQEKTDAETFVIPAFFITSSCPDKMRMANCFQLSRNIDTPV